MLQASECTKNLIGEVVLTGAGLKLDVPLGLGGCLFV